MLKFLNCQRNIHIVIDLVLACGLLGVRKRYGETKAMKGTLVTVFPETWGDEESRRSFRGVLLSIA
jgi:hypothetical protein